MKLILPWILKLALLPFFRALERYTIKSANRINLVSEGFSPYFTERYQVKNFDLFTNGIDDEFLNINFKKSSWHKGETLTVVYAGNIGDGHYTKLCPN